MPSPDGVASVRAPNRWSTSLSSAGEVRYSLASNRTPPMMRILRVFHIPPSAAAPVHCDPDAVGMDSVRAKLLGRPASRSSSDSNAKVPRVFAADCCSKLSTRDCRYTWTGSDAFPLMRNPVWFTVSQPIRVLRESNVPLPPKPRLPVVLLPSGSVEAIVTEPPGSRRYGSLSSDVHVTAEVSSLTTEPSLPKYRA